jgi:hypothetical protein
MSTLQRIALTVLAAIMAGCGPTPLGLLTRLALLSAHHSHPAKKIRDDIGVRRVVCDRGGEELRHAPDSDQVSYRPAQTQVITQHRIFHNRPGVF